MKKLLENCKIGIDYFLHQPDKTEVILQVYMLNPLYKIIETSVKFILQFLRKIIFYILQVLKTVKIK